jgi:preprotein translocase subunit SecD
MIRRSNWYLIGIIVVFSLALWVLFPIEGERFGRQGIQFGLDLEGGVRLVYQADLSSLEPDVDKDAVMDGVAEIIGNRVNPLGVTEPNIERRGDDQIVVELPNLSITDVQKERIGRTALLEFRELKEIPIGGEEEEEEERIGEEEEEEEPDGNGTDIETIMVWVPATGLIDGEEKVLNSSYFKGNTTVTTGGQISQIELHGTTRVLYSPSR